MTDASAIAPMPGSPDDDPQDRNRRYFGQQALDALAAARVLVVGAGAVGNEIVKHLGMAGVGTAIVVDPDRVTASNLNRCILFRPEHAEARLAKPLAVADAAERLGWPIHIDPHPCGIEDVPLDAWRDVQLAICGVDDDHARYFLNLHLLANALEVGESRFLIEGAMGSDFTQCRTFELPSTACLCCNWTPEYLAAVMERRRQQSCLEFYVDTRPIFPAVATQTSWVAAQMATEAIKVLAGLPTYRATGVWPAGADGRLQPRLGILIRSETARHEVRIASMLRNPRCVEPYCRVGH